MSFEPLIDRWEAAWSSKDPEAFEGVCSPQVHYEDPTTTEPLEDLEALVAHAERLWAAFPDTRLDRTGERLSGERFFAAPSKLLGTHRAALEGLPATNRFLVVHCMVYAEVKDDLVFRARVFFDLYDAAVQLGVLPAHGGLGEKALLMLRGFGLRGPGRISGGGD
ncbi:MAG: ester cyclase [Actinomycetota bacterium]|nr:ester cyclase [Actinomycetota bacterium]